MKNLKSILITIGFLSLAVGIYFYTNSWTFSTAAIIADVVGLVLIGYVIFSDWKGFINTLTRRSTRYSTNSILLVAITFGILMVVNYYANFYNKRVDTTKNQMFSLAEQTVQVLKSLEEDITVTGFFENPDVMANIQKQFQDISPRVSFKTIDPMANPEIAQLRNVTNDKPIIVEAGENETRIRQPGEEALLNAIIKVTNKESKTIYFTKGHGENSFRGDFGPENSYAVLMTALQKLNYRAGEWDLLTDDAPMAGSIVVVAGPEKEFFPEEIANLSEFVDNGGNLVYFHEPDTDSEKITKFLEEKLGVIVNDDVVLDRSSKLVLGQGGLQQQMQASASPSAKSYGQHAITEKFRYSTVYPTASSLSQAEKIDYTLTDLVLTGKTSWGETDIAGFKQGKASYEDDAPGPKTLAIAGEKTGEKQSKIIVFGDSDFCADKFVESAGNKDFILNSIAWLAGNEEQISIRPKQMGESRLQPNAPVRAAIYLPVFLIAAIGIFVFIRRR